MSDQAEIDRLRDRQLDPSTGARQRLLIRCMVALSLTLVALGEVLSIVRHETLRDLPRGDALMLLGVLVGIATPIARAVLLARWFARRGERAMVIISVVLVAIILSGLLLRH
jgi:hypothetical protein